MLISHTCGQIGQNAAVDKPSRACHSSTQLSVSNTSTLSIFHGPVYGTRLVLIAKIYQDMSALIMQQIGHPPFSPCACDQRHYEMQNKPYIRRFKGKLDTTIKDAEI
jgi:hypothetical protein